MSEREELAKLISSRHTMAAVAAILAAGYRKQKVVIEWGAAHANGVVARTYRTDKAAQAFVESMAGGGHEMKVLRREYRPATYTEWTTP